MTFEFIEYRKRDDKIAEIVLNRPDKLNAIHDEMRYEMLAALDDAERDDDVNCLILKANGRSFSGGHDLNKVGTYYGFETTKGAEKKRRPSQRVRLKRDREALSRLYLDRFLFSWVPIVAQVHGHCVGGAMILQLACDITIAAESAKIGYIEQRLGFSGTAMDLGLLTMTVGPKLAQDLVLTSRVLSGREAAEIGLVSRWAPDEELDDAVEKAAKSIARLPRDGIAIGRATKELVYGSLGLNNDRTIGYVTHSMFTNLRWEEDEHNFFKNRRDIGVSEEIRKRDKYYSGGS